MNKFSVPGVYVFEQKYTLNPLQIDTRCLSAFAGISEKGPVGTPVLINSFDEYLKVFGGFDTEGVLPLSIYSYFKCGGKECIVTRVAHKESVSCAEYELKAQKGSAKLQALTPGTWGNYLCTKLWYEYEKIKTPVVDLSHEGDFIQLEKVENLLPGDILEINFGQGKLISRQVSLVQDNKIYFTYPIHNLKKYSDVKDTLILNKQFVSILISTRNKKNETYLHLSMNKNDERYYEKYINERSAVCRIVSDGVEGIFKNVYSEYARGGCDGIADLTAADFIGHYKGMTDYSGIGTFESRDDISLISCPDLCWLLNMSGKSQDEKLQNYKAVQQAMSVQAERFAGRFAVFDIPDFFDTSDVIEYARKMDSDFSACYYPYINVIDPLDATGCKTLKIPPSGAVCGCIALTDGEKGIFHAPANCILHGSVGLSKRITQGEMGELYDHNINVLKYFPGSGVKIWGAKTLSSNSDWRYISVRRTFSRICTSIKRGTQWAVFEVNDKNLRKRLVRQVSGFLLDLWMKGYLAGSTAEQGFYVRCDEELNPPENIDNGILTFEVGLAIVKPAEFFQIKITAEKDGASVYIDEE
ncbi:MAG: phage tail sheath subtilisin-like domain-containing protein [Treponema sp.]|nr:phage tail sheath subtilisin-like domain-containing protein [Treponema sp.]